MAGHLLALEDACPDPGAGRSNRGERCDTDTPWVASQTAEIVAFHDAGETLADGACR